jgi:hypothetical protein
MRMSGCYRFNMYAPGGPRGVSQGLDYASRGALLGVPRKAAQRASLLGTHPVLLRWGGLELGGNNYCFLGFTARILPISVDFRRFFLSSSANLADFGPGRRRPGCKK